MSQNILEKHFQKIGARLKFRQPARWGSGTGVRINIQQDHQGEFFDILGRENSSRDLHVIDVQPQLRHLLLMFTPSDENHKYLCGHDERHWFVAAVPEKSAASTVLTAFEALKPATVRDELVRLHVKQKDRNRRRNAAFLRQGEWFFCPSPQSSFDFRLILSQEPLRRGFGKPHVCEELVRDGGETVYVCREYPQGLNTREYRDLLQQRPEMQNRNWRVMSRDPEVYVRGRIRHSDHKTIRLSGWHRVLMNTETQAAAMRHVAFLD